MDDKMNMEGLEQLQAQYNDLKERFGQMQIVNRQLMEQVTRQRFLSLQGKLRREYVATMVFCLAWLFYSWIRGLMSWFSVLIVVLVLAGVLFFSSRDLLKALFGKADSVSSVLSSAKTLLHYRRQDFTRRNGLLRMFAVCCVMYFPYVEGGGLDPFSLKGLRYGATFIVFFMLLFPITLKWMKKIPVFRRDEQKRQQENSWLQEIVRSLEEDESGPSCQ